MAIEILTESMKENQTGSLNSKVHLFWTSLCGPVVREIHLPMHKTGLDPWPGWISHALGQLIPLATTTGPFNALEPICSATKKPQNKSPHTAN